MKKEGRQWRSSPCGCAAGYGAPRRGGEQMKQIASTLAAPHRAARFRTGTTAGLMATLLAAPAGAAVAGPPPAPDSLDSLLRPIRQKYDLPALAGAVVTSEGLIAAGAVGVRKYGADIPVTVNDQFHLGSCTKS